MSLERLIELDERRAFEATHRYEDLELYHVPFDDLTDAAETEGPLARMATNGGRVALIGPSGSGKSSVIASVLGPLVEDLPAHVIPLRIPVAAADETTVKEPRAFAQHLVRTVVRYASPEEFTAAERERLEQVTAEVSREHGKEKSRRYSIGAPRLLTDTGFATEVRSAGQDIEHRLSAGDVVAETARMIAIFRSHDREPFFVIDDSDTWLKIAGADLTNVANAFFNRNVRMLAKELDCGFVVVVHDHYLELEGYREIQPLFSTVLSIPRFAEPAQAFERILSRRIELAEVDAVITDLLDAGALSLLAEHYGRRQNLRQVLAAVDRSVQHACSDGVAPVTAELVRTALAELA
jgi:predicted ABC-type transport system involved in lysophospholipase L1 biosynthesis ATPase subunit